MEQAHSQQQSGGIIHPDVLDALQEDSEVAVIILFPSPAAPLADVSLAEMRQNTGERQASVLADVAPNDFAVIDRYTVIPALAGMLTASGAEKLQCHADVRREGLG